MRPTALRASCLALAVLGSSALSRAADEEYAPRPVPRGEYLLGELGCVHCHAATPAAAERLDSKEAPDLMGVGARVAPAYLRRFLASPHETRTGTTMPDLLGGLGEREREERIDALVHYLASLGGPLDARPVAARDGSVEPGRQLFHRVGCVACHEAVEPAWLLEIPWSELEPAAEGDEEPEEDDDEELLDLPPGTLAPADLPLDHLTNKTTVDQLARFLLDPLAVRPSGRMPSMNLTEVEARQLALYLLRHQLDEEEEVVSGLRLEYYEETFSAAVYDFDELRPVRTGTQPTFGLPAKHRPDHFGVRLSGMLEVREAGRYTFATTSDDGSRLWIADQLVVQNDGHHPMVRRAGTIDLPAGRHPITVTMFESAGGEGLEVTWSGPGFDEQPIPGSRLTHSTLVYRLPDAERFRIDTRKAAAGARYFHDLGCVSCHTTLGATAQGTPTQRAPALADLAGAADSGCLDARPPAGAADYRLDARDRAALTETLRAPSRLDTPLTAAEQVTHAFSRLDCYACHRRDDLGGPTPARKEYFFEVGDVDLGDEGRIPPPLDAVGYKLREPYIEAVLTAGASVRPYTATRMPQFGAKNVGHLTGVLAALDARPGDDDEPPFSAAAVEHGRRLVGTNGLGCIQCHTFAGFDSLGIPAADLAETHDRIKPGWFHELLLDPIRLNMNTRMPEFWQDGKSPVTDVLDGDPARQIDAIRTYLSLGKAAPLPQGINLPESTYELFVSDRPRMVGVFMDGVSPRTICVGFPAQTHYAFDMQSSRLAKVWRGRFFNAEGTWHGRAGKLELPPSEDSFDLPAGAPFFVVDAEGRRNTALRARGRRMHPDGRVSFRYDLDGYRIEETPEPILREGGTWMKRSFVVESSSSSGDLFARLAEGASIVPRGEGTWEVDDRLVVKLPRGADVEVRKNERGRRELVLRALPDQRPGEHARTRFEVEMKW